MLHVAKCTGKKTWSVCLGGAHGSVRGMVASVCTCPHSDPPGPAASLKKVCEFPRCLASGRGVWRTGGITASFLSHPEVLRALGLSAHPPVHLYCGTNAPVGSMTLCIYFKIIGRKFSVVT